MSLAHADNAEPFQDLRTRVESAYRSGDDAGLAAAREALLKEADGAYFAAYAAFRRALAAGGSRPVEAVEHLETCIAELRILVAAEPSHAEARALLGSCLGLSTVHNVFFTMTRGPEARRQLDEARRLAPENPWVLMQDGLGDWATPRWVGGSRERAVAKLEQAARLFADLVARGSRMAAYGAAETWQQLATRYVELGRTADAAEALRQASIVDTTVLASL
jgi:tetratricopeptide (TPR) repeat protein